MNIACLGIDHNKADMEFRSRLVFTDSRYAEVSCSLKQCRDILGAIILSTCNRTEFYVHYRENAEIQPVLYSVIMDSFTVSSSDMGRFYLHKSQEALLHLFKVASGLESMVLGEDQILNQVKGAQAKAIELNSSDRVLNRVFMEAIACAKEIKSRTRISENKLSISSIAVELMERELGGLEGKKALVVGMGEMSQLAVRNLFSKGAAAIYLANRSLHKCRFLQREYTEIKLIEFDERYSVLSQVDAVISATAAPHTVFCFDRFADNCPDKGMIAIDLAVPRDIDEKVGLLPNVKLYDIDHFKLLSEQNAALRQKLAEDALDIISEHLKELMLWDGETGIHYLLSKVDTYTENQVAANAISLMHKLELGENPSRSDAVEYALRLTNRMLKKMVLKLKAMPEEKSEQYAVILEELLK